VRLEILRRVARGPRGSRAALACACALVAAPLLAPRAEAAKPADPDKLSVTRVRDLHYGDVLFYFYQGENFEALTRLTAFDSWGRLPSHQAETQLLLGGLYLELGMHNEAGARFERLLGPEVPVGVRNRAWFYLAKIWYVRGYLERAEAAIRRIDGRLPRALESERMHLLANAVMRQGRFAEATRILDGWQGPTDWTAYARFNLGVALVRDGRLEEAAPQLEQVGTLDTDRPELLALRDRANVALGFAWLQAKQPAKAREVLQRVRLDGPFSTRALLGAGWADAELGDYRGALTPWLELRERSLLDAAVQESFLAVPYAFAKLDATAQSVEYYESAVQSFESETVQIDAAIERVRAGTMLESIVEREATGGTYGWFWQLRELPAAPETRYLYSVLAGHDFQEGLKNYRDLAFLGRTLTRWSESFDAYGDMIDARERAFSERLPRADELLARDGATALVQRRNDAESRLAAIAREADVAALGTADQREQWERIRRVEEALALEPEGPGKAEAAERLRLVRGVLYWELAASFRGRMFEQRRSLRDLDVLLRETQNRWERLALARASVPANTGEFGQRLAVAAEKLNALRERLVATRARQNDLLAALAVRELAQQKERLNTYQLQARFALATIYDRATMMPSEPAGAAPGEPARTTDDAAVPVPQSAPPVPRSAPPGSGP
jgi:tetratricopeptide (TPR) repeat protein